MSDSAQDAYVNEQYKAYEEQIKVLRQQLAESEAKRRWAEAAVDSLRGEAYERANHDAGNEDSER